MKKISEEHLKTIQEQQKKLNDLLNQIGYVSAQKHGLLHEFGEVNKTVEDFKSVLEAEYGQININVETGEYTEIKEEDIDKLKIAKEPTDVK
jgi:calcineurin-like phosphoesterase family protein|tara:strand:+ start:995 stop:1270 length:276 start_codon:yes stop_codon:yes gene_type:complete